jgi:hypothetical protein
MRILVYSGFTALVLSSPIMAQEGGDSLSRAYIQACYTGMVYAQKVLPDIPQNDEMLKRGYLSCDGSLVRMSRTGQLAKETSVSELGCGYAAGAMFAKYGFPHEADPPSKRLIDAATACIRALRKQGIH